MSKNPDTIQRLRGRNPSGSKLSVHLNWLSSSIQCILIVNKCYPKHELDHVPYVSLSPFYEVTVKINDSQRYMMETALIKNLQALQSGFETPSRN